jgi:hypothetical protein
MEYGELEAKLAALHGVDEAETIAFRGRLRVLRLLGIPDKPRVGSGKRQDFSEADVFEMHVSLTLDAFGLPPQRVASAVKYLRDQDALPRILETMRNEDDESAWLVLGMHSRVGKAQNAEVTYSLSIIPAGVLHALIELRQARGPAQWKAFIDAAQLVKDIRT